MVPVREPSGGWSLAIDRTDLTLLGIAVISPAGEWRIVSIANDGSRFEVQDLADWADAVCFVELPNHPRPVALQSFVANTALGGAGGLLPLAPQPETNRYWVGQWALLRLAEQFGAIWRDTEQRSDTMVAVGGVPANIGERTGFGSLRVWSGNGGPVLIVASGPPFSRLPMSGDFIMDPEVEQSRPVITGTQLRPCRPADLEQVKNLMEREKTAFDPADLERVGSEIQLATRAGRLGKPLAGHQCQFASAEYWVLTERKAFKETVLGVAGILQFYGVPEELWIGYLCRYGSILTEAILRRGRELGFEHVYVWTTPDNPKAIEWYEKKAGFFRSTNCPHDNLSGGPSIAFQRPTLLNGITLNRRSS